MILTELIDENEEVIANELDENLFLAKVALQCQRYDEAIDFL